MSSYFNGGAILRADLMGVVQEGLNSERTYGGLKLAPAFGVDRENGQYPKLRINGGNLLRDEFKRQAAGSARARISRSWDTDTYDTVPWALEEAVADELRAKLGSYAFSADTAAIKNLSRQGLIRHELQVQAAIQNTSNWSVTTSVTAYTTANIATFDVGLDVDTAKAAIAVRGEDISQLTLGMSLDVYIRLRASTKLQNRARGQLASDSILDLGEQAVADALGVSRVVVLGGFYDSSAQGASSSTISAIWNNTYMWLGSVSEGDLLTGGAVRTLNYTGVVPDLFAVESYREDQTASDIIRVSSNHVVKVINGNAGQLIATQYS